MGHVSTTLPESGTPKSPYIPGVFGGSPFQNSYHMFFLHGSQVASRFETLCNILAAAHEGREEAVWLKPHLDEAADFTPFMMALAFASI